ncbi:PREDICTED: probable serine/threonine-protein kinase DDB_G0277071 [Trachymyrmex septentrionalis]|uniref:probable serine/threonine-protein kinase DDB_G0277071 n=1 Tax=Trachymyrmex septentrionalis TaxID=34720 RepID=UPI00084EED97|nr:PREDICTED: probable serine/threonine-protein kinase DDB_G0277071 [Trachymyrmex septentrionalis]
MAARTGEGEGESPATVFDNNAGIVTTAGSLAESSTSSSSSSSATAAAAAAAVPTVILTESTATSAGSLPLGSQQQGNLHQVHQQQQQQQSRQRDCLIADVPVNDVAGNLNDSLFKSLLSLMCRLPTPLLPSLLLSLS